MLRLPIVSVLFSGVLLATGKADETAVPLTLETAPPPAAIDPDEPMRANFSARAAAEYLDAASLDWQKNRGCVTCHTNMSYLMARPVLDGVFENSGEVKDFFAKYYSDRKPKPRKGSYEAVVIATGLVFHDHQNGGALTKSAATALDNMWSTQKEDGSWTWIKCGWAPMEIDDHFGVTLAALTAGLGSELGYQPRSDQGLRRIRKYLDDHPAPSLHHRMMISWASKRTPGLMNEAQQAAIIREIFANQLPDGGWSTAASLADWDEFQRLDSQTPQTNTSDAYATGLSMIVTCELGVSANDKRIQQAARWLKNNQRVSGKWFAASPSKDSQHLFSNYASAFAILGLQAAGEFPAPTK